MKGSRSTMRMRTLRIGKVELASTRERAGDGGLDGGDRDDREVRGPRTRLAKGTQWPPAAPLSMIEEEAHDVPASALAPDDDDPDDALIRASPLAQLDPDDDEDEPLPPVGVEVEVGTRPLMGLGTRPYTAMRAVVDAAASARWAITYGSVEVTHAPPVQPPPADRSRGPAETSERAAASPAPRGNGRRTLAGARAIGVLLLVVAAAALAAYVTATAL